MSKNTHDAIYLETLGEVVENGRFKADRTGVGSFSVFGRLARYCLKDNKLPILTTKRIFFKSFIVEMLWFISGASNLKFMLDHGVTIWNSWVLKGTEKYRPMNSKEITKAICERFGVDTLDVLLVDSIESKDPAKITKFQLTHIEERGTDLTILVSKAFFKRRTNAFVHSLPHLEALYEIIFETPSQALSDGDVGPGVYGMQWRFWEDTRIVPLEKFAEVYYKRGYETVAIPTDPKYAGKVVITRTLDQLKNAINLLKTQPDSRRNLVLAYNPARIDDVGLPPCHAFYQFMSREMDLKELLAQDNSKLPGFRIWLTQHMLLQPGDNEVELINQGTEGSQMFRKGARDALFALRQEAGLPVRYLSCLLYMRSNDLPIGKPFNISQYGMLVHMVAQCAGMVAEELVWVAGDAHYYANQIAGVKTQLAREPIETTVAKVELNKNITDIDAFGIDDINIVGYDEYHPHIKFPVAV